MLLTVGSLFSRYQRLWRSNDIQSLNRLRVLLKAMKDEASRRCSVISIEFEICLENSISWILKEIAEGVDSRLLLTFLKLNSRNSTLIIDKERKLLLKIH